MADGIGVGVYVAVGDGVGVSVGREVEVGVGVEGANPGRLQAWMDNNNITMAKRCFFMKRTIHGRE
ncbi:MAG: hypothetical protein A2Y88_12810 [Chloroflexi bacterium RBG_13_48_10]|nr:MAG: hypothetical protein A2Y88_12810 [Chloroflexi bacterium RBG_13_48_10]